MNQQQSDPVIDEIREVRHQISARVDHNPARLVKYYLKPPEQYRDRLVDTSTTTERTDQSAA
jgi:hypothetical protein